MKLIEVDRLIRDINDSGVLSEYSNEYFRIIDLIGNQPVAYDTERVCEQLEKHSQKFSHYEENNQYITVPRDDYVEIDTALNIVKKGGVVQVNQVKSLTENDILNKFDFEQRRAYSTDEIRQYVRELFE